jgi:hypothetical protein
MKPLLAMDNSLSQVQVWLSKTIDKNSTSRSGNVTDSISRVRFDGCNLSYKVGHEIATEPSPSESTKPVNYYMWTTTLAFDLREMNINGITMTPLIANSNMLQLTLPALEGKQNVKFTTDGSLPKLNRSGFQSAATMTLSRNVAEEVKTRLALAAKLCQAP